MRTGKMVIVDNLDNGETLNLVDGSQVTLKSPNELEKAEALDKKREMLEHYEIIVENGFYYFYHAGQALEKINKEKLYRLTHNNFALYVSERFNLTAKQAYDFIAASKVVENIKLGNTSPIGDGLKLPENEAQARPLAKIHDPANQVKAWEEVKQHSKATGEPITAKLVQEKAEPYQAPKRGKKEAASLGLEKSIIRDQINDPLAREKREEKENWGKETEQPHQITLEEMIEGGEEEKCRVCGCTQNDCSQCIERTGTPCSWVDESLCSACLNPEPKEDPMDTEIKKLLGENEDLKGEVLKLQFRLKRAEGAVFENGQKAYEYDKLKPLYDDLDKKYKNAQEAKSGILEELNQLKAKLSPPAGQNKKVPKSKRIGHAGESGQKGSLDIFLDSQAQEFAVREGFKGRAFSPYTGDLLELI
jgi:hypothetical protein